MAMLDRYKKAGGFNQLVALLETCGPAKREKFMELIRQEDPRWANALGSKLLDMNRVFTWEDQTLMEVFNKVQDLTAAIVIKTIDEANQNRILGFLPQSQIRRLRELMETTTPNPAEIATLHMRFLQDVRKMAQEGIIRLEKIDPSLVIEPNIEEILSKEPSDSPVSASDFTIEYESSGANAAPEEKVEAAAPGDDKARIAELSAMRKKVADMQKEIAILRRELVVAKGKLDQIKKIA